MSKQSSVSATNQPVEYRDEVPGFPGYRVGSDGTVWTCWQQRWTGGQGSGSVTEMGPEWKQKNTYNYKGYRGVTVRVDGTSRRIVVFVHRLILLGFVGPRPQGMECLHGDGNPSNNRLDNIRWGTPKENGQDKQRHGTQVFGETQGLVRLTEDNVREILTLRGKMTQKQLGERFNVHPNTIYQIYCGNNWRHISRLPSRRKKSAS